MELHFETNVEKPKSITQVEALKTLTKLLLQEVEKLAEHSYPERIVHSEMKDKLNDKVQQFEIDLICQALIIAGGNQRKAASILGTKNSTLHAKIRRYQIDLFPVFSNVLATEDSKNDVREIG